MIGGPRTEVLAERYFAVLMGDLGNLFVLMLQVPVIAAIICVIWTGARPDDRLHVALCLSAIWLGLFNSCREVVKERALYDRERRLFLTPTAYLASKVYVLAGLCALQDLLLLWSVNYYVGLTGSKLLLYVALLLGSIGGTCLGLLISCLVATSDRAVALAPVVMLPQVFFCKGFMPYETAHGVVAWLQRSMLVEWDFRVFGHFLRIGRDVDWLACGLDLAALGAYILALFGLSVLVLAWEELG